MDVKRCPECKKIMLTYPDGHGYYCPDCDKHYTKRFLEGKRPKMTRAEWNHIATQGG